MLFSILSAFVTTFFASLAVAVLFVLCYSCAVRADTRYHVCHLLSYVVHSALILVCLVLFTALQFFFFSHLSALFWTFFSHCRQESLRFSILVLFLYCCVVAISSLARLFVMVLFWEPNKTKGPGCGYGVKRVSHAFRRNVRVGKNNDALLHGFAASLALASIRAQ